MSSLPSPWLQESLLNLSWSLKMSGRPQVPKRFVGGPLRGPPPPKGWNFFIPSSCAVAALAFERCY